MSHDVEIVRIVRAAPETCFAQLQDRAALARWWGPKDDAGAPFAAAILAWDLTVGAPWRVRLTAPNGAAYEQGGRALETAPPHLLRLSFAWISEQEAGAQSEAAFRFEPHRRGTRLAVTHSALADAEARDAHISGWETCLERLVEALPDAEPLA